MKDLETIESRYAKTQKVASTGNKDAKIEFAVLQAYKECLESGKNARTVEFESKEEQEAAKNNINQELLENELERLRKQ